MIWVGLGQITLKTCLRIPFLFVPFGAVRGTGLAGSSPEAGLSSAPGAPGFDGEGARTGMGSAKQQAAESALLIGRALSATKKRF